MSNTLYERLGGEKGIKAIARDTVENHLKNPVIKVRFQDSDPEELISLAAEFFCMGSGGPQKYTGKNMREAHRSMNISEAEFLTVVDDIMSALDNNKVEAGAKNEVLGILYSLKDDVIKV